MTTRSTKRTAPPTFPLAGADVFFGVFGMRRERPAPICAWCLKPLDGADHTACRRIAGGGGA